MNPPAAGAKKIQPLKEEELHQVKGAANPRLSTPITVRSQGSSVMFYTSVVKQGGVFAMSEYESQYQLARSGVVKPTLSNYGREAARVREYSAAAKKYSDTFEARKWLCNSETIADTVGKTNASDELFQLLEVATKEQSQPQPPSTVDGARRAAEDTNEFSIVAVKGKARGKSDRKRDRDI